MAGGFHQTATEQLKNHSKNPNTVKSLAEENEAEKLNKLLETFYAEVKNKNGDYYEPGSLRVMIATLDRHLNEQWYKFSIILRGREFHSFKQVLRGKARKLRQSGIDKRSNKDRSLTEEEV